MPSVLWPLDVNLEHQATEIQSGKRGETGVWKSATWDRSVLTAPDQPQTLFELFEQSVARHPDQYLYMHRPIIPTAPPNLSDAPTYGNTLIGSTYAAVQARRTALGSALLGLERAGRLRSSTSTVPSPVELTQEGVPYYGNHNRLKNGARRGWAVGLWTKNREEWQVVDLACQAYGLVGVSLYETLGPDVAQYITNHCPLSIIFASTNHIPSILKMAPKCPSLKIVVAIDPLTRAERDVLSQWANSVNLELLDMLELEKWGTEEGVRCDPGPVKGVAGEHELDRDRIMTISYTSGTTGDPKGVVLTNYNLTTAAISNSFGTARGVEELSEPFRYFSFMPLSHIYERFLHLVIIFTDGTACFSTGDPLRLLEDAQVIKPHFMAGVPRVFNRIYAAVKAQMNTPGLKGALLRRAVATKLENLHNSGELKHTVYDALVFRKIRALLGGDLQYITSGAAPLLPDVHRMLKVCFSCEVVQGYGMTESVGTCCRGIGWDHDAVGTVGVVQPCNDAKLVDVPDMGYTSRDLPNPRGELCLKGSNIFVGYLHDKVNTAKTIDKDGWMHTADVAELDQQGRLKIVDRIKNVVKLSQGEYVALEKLEGIYGLDPIFASLLVHADPARSHLVALAVCDPMQAAKLVSSVLKQNVTSSDIALLEKAVKDKRVRNAVVQSMGQVGKENKLNGFEMVKGIYLTLNPFPDDILTPTLKVKRGFAAKNFKKEIDAMYEENESAEAQQLAAKI